VQNIKPRWWHNHFKRLASTPFGVWVLSNTLHHIDNLFLKLSNNRLSLTCLLSGVPIIILSTTGAKSGLSRQLPLVALTDEDKKVLIASFYGNSRHPAWYYNLKANPLAKVTDGQKTALYTVRQAEGQEREHYWEMALALYPGYNFYQQLAGKREIPVVVLEPITEPDR